MLYLWLLFIFEILIYSLLINIFHFDDVALSFIFVFVHTFVTMLYIFHKKKNKWSIYVGAYFIRIFTMFWDIYARNIFTLVGSGADSEGFLRTAINISRDLSLLHENVYGNLYTKILGVIIYMTSENRIIPHYLNVLLGLSIILLSDKIFSKLDFDFKTHRRSLILLSFFPISIIHSGILLRENMISFFLLLSFYQFLKWLDSQSIGSMITALLLVLISAIMHSATIVIAVGYIFAYIFYDERNNKLSFSFKSIFSFFFSVVVLGIILSNESLFLAKFSKMESLSDLNQIAVSGWGGSVYLTGINVNNPLQLIVFSPIKMLYFLGSPMPLNWRGINDVITFFIDGLIYLILTIQIVRNYRKSKEKNYPMLFLGISIFSFLFVFGIGINNAGTALRHRNKIFPLLVILWASLKNQTLREREYR